MNHRSIQSTQLAIVWAMMGAAYAQESSIDDMLNQLGLGGITHQSAAPSRTESPHTEAPQQEPSIYQSNTPLHAAVLAGKPSAVKAALSDHRHLEARDSSDMTPLMLAAYKDRATSAKLLIQAGADTEAANTRWGTTALMLAAMRGHHEVVIELLRGKAKVNATNHAKVTALMLAAQHGHADIVKLLLNSGANKNMQDSTGKRAIDYADKAEVISILTN